MEKKNFSISVSGEKLAFYREKAGLTQEELAEKIKATRATVGNWESKKNFTLKNDKAMYLLIALNVTEKELAYQEEEKGADILDSPLIKSYVEQINLQKKYIEILERDIATLKRRLGE